MFPLRCLVSVWIFAMVSCSPVTSAWMSGWTASAARDHIMLVREEPPSLGYRRLAYQSDIFPGLRGFIAVHGQPDFLAETRGGGIHYLVFYYLNPGRVFVMHTRGSGTGSMECDGPYALGHKERIKLDELLVKSSAGGA